MYEKLKECPVCSSDNILNHKVVKDHSISQESFVIMKCANCNFQFTNPRPDQDNIGKFYESDDYISHTNKGNNPINIIYKLVRNYSTQNKIKLIKKISKKDKAKILDYGTGTGFFLNAIKEKGWKTVGVEPDQKARENAEKLLGQKIYADLKEIGLLDNKYDVITLWHVLEHIHDLNQVFSTLKGLLKEKGKIIIAVPNIDSLDNKIYKEDWAAYDVPRHLYHFNKETLSTFTLKHGMKVKNIYPMKFDSYYISMLSEKYQKGNGNIVKSIINGYKSNSYASKNHNNYSSLIFEIKK